MANEAPVKNASTEDPGLIYQEAWEHHRYWSRSQWLLFLGWIPGAGGLTALLGCLTGSDHVVFLVAIPWAAAWVFSIFKSDTLICPRCGKRFFHRDYFRNSFSRKCLNCGLPKWSGSTFGKPVQETPAKEG